MEGVWGRLHVAIYTEAFDRIGVPVAFRQFPLKRLSHIMDTCDDLDGDISRVRDYGEAHPRLLRVEEPHSSSAINAYATTPNLNLDGWDSLVGKGYRVDYRHGSKKTPEMLNKRLPPESLHNVHSIESGLLRLIEGRSDIFLSSGAGVFLEEGSFRGTPIFKAGVMERTTFHLFLLKKHEGLAGRLSEVLRQMKREGRINHYRKEVGLPPL